MSDEEQAQIVLDRHLIKYGTWKMSALALEVSAALAAVRAEALEEAAEACDALAATADDRDAPRWIWYGRDRYAEQCALKIRALAKTGGAHE